MSPHLPNFSFGGVIFNEFLNLDIIAKQRGPMAMMLFSNSSPGLRPQTLNRNSQPWERGSLLELEEIDSWAFVLSSVLALG